MCPDYEPGGGANAVVFQPNDEPAARLEPARKRTRAAFKTGGGVASGLSLTNLDDTFVLSYDSIEEIPEPTARVFTSKTELALARVLRAGAHEEPVGRNPFGSRLGGDPSWVQSPKRPACSGCRAPMPFVAQISTAQPELFEQISLGDGALIYLFFCDAHGTGKLLSQGF